LIAQSCPVFSLSENPAENFRRLGWRGVILPTLILFSFVIFSLALGGQLGLLIGRAVFENGAAWPVAERSEP
jgi:hypothetical protein